MTPVIKPPSRSAGLKLLLVFGLALIMSIPAVFVFALLWDRTHRAEAVVQEVGNLVGGPQTFTGPVLRVPYVIPAHRDEGSALAAPAVNGALVIFPQKADGRVATKTTVRKRGLFKTPVWNADVTLQSSFDLTGAEAKFPHNAVVDWGGAQILAGVQDPRGARSDVLLDLAGKTVSMAPDSLSVQGDGSRPGRFFSAPATEAAKPGAQFEATAHLKFSGAESLAVTAYGLTTHLAISGDWADPSYSGSFAREGDAGGETTARGTGAGYSAAWSVPFVARGVAQSGDADTLGQLASTAMRVSFVDLADPYQAVSRSLKYAPLFIGLVFLCYFLFETTQRKRVHPAQYILIGLAQLIFYLLLLSIAERVGFDLGFAAAAAATVGLISAYAGWVFESRRQTVAALIVFSALYGLIYVLMRLEDWALLVGAVTSFLAIATVMYATRKVDWYGQASNAADT